MVEQELSFSVFPLTKPSGSNKKAAAWVANWPVCSHSCPYCFIRCSVYQGERKWSLNLKSYVQCMLQYCIPPPPWEPRADGRSVPVYYPSAAVYSKNHFKIQHVYWCTYKMHSRPWKAVRWMTPVACAAYIMNSAWRGGGRAYRVHRTQLPRNEHEQKHSFLCSPASRRSLGTQAIISTPPEAELDFQYPLSPNWDLQHPFS